MFSNHTCRPRLFGCGRSAEAHYITGRSKQPTGEVDSSPCSNVASLTTLHIERLCDWMA